MNTDDDLIFNCICRPSEPEEFGFYVKRDKLGRPVNDFLPSGNV